MVKYLLPVCSHTLSLSLSLSLSLHCLALCPPFSVPYKKVSCPVKLFSEAFYPPQFKISKDIFPQFRSFFINQTIFIGLQIGIFSPSHFRISLGILENGHQMLPQGFTWMCHPAVVSVVAQQQPVVAFLQFLNSLGKIRLTHPLHSSPLFRVRNLSFVSRQMT